MLRDLSKLIDDEDSEGGDGDQLQKELRQAAQQLWRAQFIYENDWGMKTSYEALRRHMGYDCWSNIRPSQMKVDTNME